MIIWKVYKSEHIGWCVCATEGGYRSRHEAPIPATDEAQAVEIERRENRLENLIDHERSARREAALCYTDQEIRGVKL